jgi:hypothetical protein
LAAGGTAVEEHIPSSSQSRAAAAQHRLSYIPVLTCGFASHYASWTVAQHSNSTITELTETGVEIRNWDGLRQRAEE